MIPTLYQNFIFISRYARWLENENRRETWEECIDRYFSFFIEYLKLEEDISYVKQEVLTLGVMPSMRAIMTAGPALARDHVAGYNCAYRAIDDTRAFDEILYVLMCGTGVGFSVERNYVSLLPVIPDTLTETGGVISVRDSKLGWAEALKELISELYSGNILNWDTSKVRPSGRRLKTMGGRSSGPGPLEDLFRFTIQIFKGAAGRKLTSLECHDLVCRIGDCVVVGGVRRSALLSLSNLSDQRMRDAKSGQWWEANPQRMLSNNSVAYSEKPDVGSFMSEWLSLYVSKSGERGIFNREAARLQTTKSGRRKGYWDTDDKIPIDFGTNPCSEIILRPKQFCNLTEIIAKSTDTFCDLKRKAKIATILGTWQAALTNFRYLTKSWKTNCEEERLLGVSITGIMDSPHLNNTNDSTSKILQTLKDICIETNREWSKRLNILPATAITCVKPSGTVSQLTDSSSGIHPRYAKYYVRRIRQDMKDPLTTFMISKGFPYEKDATKPNDILIFSFPCKAPEGSITREDLSAITQLEHWKFFQDNWCEHKPSITISVKETEWPKIGAWVWENFDSMTGIALLPYTEHIYQQPPYEEVTEKQHDELVKKIPVDIDWAGLSEYEFVDTTTSSKELACTAGVCEV